MKIARLNRVFVCLALVALVASYGPGAQAATSAKRFKELKREIANTPEDSPDHKLAVKELAAAIKANAAEKAEKVQAKAQAKAERQAKAKAKAEARAERRRARAIKAVAAAPEGLRERLLGSSRLNETKLGGIKVGTKGSEKNTLTLREAAQKLVDEKKAAKSQPFSKPTVGEPKNVRVNPGLAQPKVSTPVTKSLDETMKMLDAAKPVAEKHEEAPGSTAKARPASADLDARADAALKALESVSKKDDKTATETGKAAAEEQLKRQKATLERVSNQAIQTGVREAEAKAARTSVQATDAPASAKPHSGTVATANAKAPAHTEPVARSAKGTLAPNRSTRPLPEAPAAVGHVASTTTGQKGTGLHASTAPGGGSQSSAIRTTNRPRATSFVNEKSLMESLKKSKAAATTTEVAKKTPATEAAAKRAPSKARDAVTANKQKINKAAASHRMH